MRIRAVLFDLYGTLVHVINEVSDDEASEYLFNRGYEISPQQFKAAWYFVSIVDYPKYGYGDWNSFLKRVFWRLEVEVDEETFVKFRELSRKSRNVLYPEVGEAVSKVKSYGFRTAIVTTTPHFFFEEAIEPIKKYFDFICTGYEARCDKSNPKMYRKVLDVLDVKPEETVVIGDDLRIDVLLPKKLGMRTILLDRKMESRDSSIPDAVAKDLREAVEIVVNWSKVK